ncbi:MAG: VTT domain-containing protein [Acidobacteria bacterium]|nr:VTT domain-containing protein [Acidobacteriota bacterium]
MRAIFSSLLSYFLTPGGLLLMGALDSSIIFFLPLGIDFVVVILTARKPEFFWWYALLATAGSIIGASLTFWLGRKVGEAGLSRMMKPSTLKRVEQRVSHSAAYTIAGLGIIPPPFPFTAFVLTSGALRVNPLSFLTALAGVRLARFMIEAGLAAYYGRGILAFMESKTFTLGVIALSALAVLGTIVSAVAVYRSARSGSRGTRHSSPL